MYTWCLQKCLALAFFETKKTKNKRDILLVAKPYNGPPATRRAAKRKWQLKKFETFLHLTPDVVFDRKRNYHHHWTTCSRENEALDCALRDCGDFHIACQAFPGTLACSRHPTSPSARPSIPAPSSANWSWPAAYHQMVQWPQATH